MKEILAKILHLNRENDRLFLLIDGQATSGKTTYAKRLHEELEQFHKTCQVLCYDDYYHNDLFVRAFDFRNYFPSRFIEEVLTPYKQGKKFKVHCFNGQEHCYQTHYYQTERHVSPPDILILEGVSVISIFDEIADIRLLMTKISDMEQQARLKRRYNGDIPNFWLDEWIPAESELFDSFSYQNKKNIHHISCHF